MKTKDGKVCCVKVLRPDSHPGMYCIWRMDAFSVADEMDGCEVGDQITLEYCEMTEQELKDLPDFEGW